MFQVANICFLTYQLFIDVLPYVSLMSIELVMLSNHGHAFEYTPEDSEGQGSLVCCSPWDDKELDMTEWLNGNWIITVQLTKV